MVRFYAPLGGHWTLQHSILMSSGHSEAIRSAGNVSSSSQYWELRRVLERWESRDNAVFYSMLFSHDVTGAMVDRHGHLGRRHASNLVYGVYCVRACVLSDHCPPLTAIQRDVSLPLI